MALSYFDRQTLSVLAPTITKKLGIDDRAYGWLAAGFTIAYFLATPLAGRLVDRVGARRALYASVAVWSLAAGLPAAAVGFASLFAARAALGLTESPSFPSAVQVVDRALPVADRARGMGLLMAGMSLGSTLAPLLAIWLLGRWGWRVAFLGTAAVAALWWPIWFLLTRRPEVRALLDRPRTGRTGAPSWKDGAHPAVLRASLALVASIPATTMLAAWEAKMFVAQFHVSQQALAHYLWLPPLAYDAGAILFGDLAARSMRRSPGVSPRGLFAIAALLSAAVAAIPFAPGAVLALAVDAACSFGRGGVFAIANADMLPRLPSPAVGAASGVITAILALAAFGTNPTIGHLVGPWGYRGIAIAIGAFVVPGSVAWLLWRPPPPASHPEHTK